MRMRRWLTVEWAFYGRRVRIVAIIVVIFVLGTAFEIGEALLPHKVLNTELKYEEKSNGIREYFGTGIREVPSRSVPLHK